MQPSVERCQLAPDLSIARVLTGLWQVADMERGGNALDPDAAAAALVAGIDAGFDSFDMADHYGSAETIAGRLPADRVQRLTKWVPAPGPVRRDDVRAAVQRSLDRLAADRIDLLQFHAWSYADPTYVDCLFWLQELKQEGLIRCLGLTNFDTAHLRVVVHSGIEVVSNQVCYSLIDSRPQAAMAELCLQHGIALLAYGTLAGGFLTDDWVGRPEPDMADATWSRMKYRRFIDAAGGWSAFQDLLHVLQGVARRHGVSIANVACRSILDRPAVGGIIVGARPGQSDHVAENLRLFDLDLDPASRAEIDDAVAALQPVPGDCGDEYRRPPFLTASGDLSDHLDSLQAPYPVVEATDGRTRVLSGTEWERIAGFCRALRRGDRIRISGTTATHGERLIGGADPAAQTHFAIDKIDGALQSLGAQLRDVVRTRVYVRDLADWEAVARVHGERFRDILPANTLVRADLVGDEYRVEIEAEAEIEDA